MVIFYLGAGSFMIFFFDQSSIDKATRVIIGTAFLIYGTFRAFRAFFQIKEIFFNKETDDE
jgi:prolipoprotein diacylglyceryltransferase